MVCNEIPSNLEENKNLEALPESRQSHVQIGLKRS
jgi:hypothetical protein